MLQPELSDAVGEHAPDHGIAKGRAIYGDKSGKVITPPPVRPRWVPDAEETACFQCETPFTFVRRRHHCRGCGHLFCYACCDWWLIPPAELGYDTVQRFCESCHCRLSSIDFSRTYDAWGDPNNPAIILIHGASGSRRNWAILGPELAKNGFYAISVDMPAHGSRYKEKLTMDSALDAIAEAIQALVPAKQAFIMGGSMGGYIAMAFGGRYTKFCKGLIVGQAGTDMKNSRTMLKAMGVYYRMLSRKTKSTLLQKTYRYYPLKAEIEKEAMFDLFMSTGVFLDHWDDIVELMTGEDYDEHLKAVGDMPVLIFNGEIDFREAEMKWLNACKNGRLEIIKDAGHMCTVDPRYRDQAKQFMVDFMQEVLKDAAAELTSAVKEDIDLSDPPTTPTTEEPSVSDTQDAEPSADSQGDKDKGKDKDIVDDPSDGDSSPAE